MLEISFRAIFFTRGFPRVRRSVSSNLLLFIYTCVLVSFKKFVHFRDSVHTTAVCEDGKSRNLLVHNLCARETYTSRFHLRVRTLTTIFSFSCTRTSVRHFSTVGVSVGKPLPFAGYETRVMKRAFRSRLSRHGGRNTIMTAVIVPCRAVFSCLIYRDRRQITTRNRVRGVKSF